MADASRHKLFIVPEVTYGVTPENGTFIPIRHTGTTLGMAKGAQLSEELRADRQIADYRHGTRQIGGDITCELSYGSLDDLLEAVLGGTWAAGPVGGAIAAEGVLVLEANPTANDTMTIGATTYTFVAAENFDNALEIPIGATLAATKASILSALAGTDGINAADPAVTAASWEVDDLTLIAETAGLAGNSIVTTETFTSDDNFFLAATLTGGADAGASLDQLKAGTERRSFSILRVFEDMGPTAKKYHLFNGVEFNTFSLGVTPDGITSISFGVIGRDAGISDALPAGADIDTPPTTTRVFNGFGGSITENDAEIAVATEIQATLENGIEPRFVIGSDKSIKPSIGRSNLTGTLGSWFEDATLIGKFIDEDNSSIEFTLTDPDGNSYLFTIPNISYTGGQPDVSGQASIPLSVPFQAVYDATLQTNLRIVRIPA